MINATGDFTKAAVQGFGSQFNGLMQPFDESLYSGYSTYNNWKVPSTPSSLAKAGFAWGLTGSSFNMNSNPLGSNYGSNNANSYGSMYSAVVSASSTSPTSDTESKNTENSQQQQQQYPPMPKLKSSPTALLKEANLEQEGNERSPESGPSTTYNPLV